MLWVVVAAAVIAGLSQAVHGWGEFRTTSAWGAQKSKKLLRAHYVLSLPMFNSFKKGRQTAVPSAKKQWGGLSQLARNNLLVAFLTLRYRYQSL